VSQFVEDEGLQSPLLLPPGFHMLCAPAGDAWTCMHFRGGGGPACRAQGACVHTHCLVFATSVPCARAFCGVATCRRTWSCGPASFAPARMSAPCSARAWCLVARACSGAHCITGGAAPAAQLLSFMPASHQCYSLLQAVLLWRAGRACSGG